MFRKVSPFGLVILLFNFGLLNIGLVSEPVYAPFGQFLFIGHSRDGWGKGSITRVNINNPTGVADVVTSLCAPGGGAAKGSKIYFVDSGFICGQPSRIIRFNLDGSGIETVFSSSTIHPEGPSFDAAGNLFFNTRDFANGAVWRILGGEPGAMAEQVTAAQATFGEGTAFDESGRLYQVEAGFTYIAYSKIRRFEPPFIPSNIGTVFKDLAGKAPVGILIKDNIVYVSNWVPYTPYGNILRFDLNGNDLGYYATDLNTPFHMQFDPAGNLYVAEHHAGTVRKITPGGTKTILVSGLGTGCCPDIGPVGVVYAEGPVSDTSPPTAPTNLQRTTPGNDNTPTFTWSAATDNVGVTDYQVSVDGGPFTSFGNVLTFTITAPQADGSHTFAVRARDADGNVGTAASLSYSIEATPPSVGSLTPTTAIVGILTTYSAPYSDNVGVTYCYFAPGGEGVTYPMTLSAPGGTSGTASRSHTFTTVGSRSVVVGCWDASGNFGSSFTFINVVDLTPPIISGVMPTTANAGYPTTFSASFSDNSAIVGCNFIADGVNQGPMFLSASPGGASGWASRPHTFTTKGTHTAQVQCTDAGGNLGTGSITTIIVGQVDSDGDSISDNVDTAPTSSSKDFSDQAIGGTTFGTVISATAGATFTIAETPNPEGVTIEVTGPAGSKLIVKLCAQTGNTFLEPGTHTVTCASTIIQVTSGKAQYLVTGISVNIGTGGKATISEGLTAGQVSSVTVVSNLGTTQVQAGDSLVSIGQGGSATFSLTATSVTVSTTSGAVSVSPGTIVANAAAEAIVHGAKYDRVSGTIVGFKKDKVEVKAHRSDGSCSGTVDGVSFTGTVERALSTLPRTLRAKFIHLNCASRGAVALTGIDGRAIVYLAGGFSYMLTANDFDDPAIWYSTAIRSVGAGEVQSFGFHKFVVSGSYYAYPMSAAVVVSSDSNLNLQYPDYVDWVYSPDGVYMYYPFLLKFEGTWTVQVCTSVPSGYQLVGSSCQQVMGTNESKVVLFQVQKLGSPDPNMKVKIKTTSKGKTQNLDLDVPGKKSAKGQGKSEAPPLSMEGILPLLLLIAAMLPMVGLSFHRTARIKNMVARLTNNMKPLRSNRHMCTEAVN